MASVVARASIGCLWAETQQCRIEGVLWVLQHPGPQFFEGPQLVGVEKI